MNDPGVGWAPGSRRSVVTEPTVVTGKFLLGTPFVRWVSRGSNPDLRGKSPLRSRYAQRPKLRDHDPRNAESRLGLPGGFREGAYLASAYPGLPS